MPIYTKTGDKGMTSLYGGKRVAKDDLQVEAYGYADELTSVIGLVVTKMTNEQDKSLLTTIQKDIYNIMAFLANAPVDISPLKGRVKSFERSIDKITSKLPKLNRFIIPGGTQIGSLLHIVRTLTRKTERRIVALFKSKGRLTSKQFNNKMTSDVQTTSTIIQYLNRLSDLFFTLARKYSKDKEVML